MAAPAGPPRAQPGEEAEGFFLAELERGDRVDLEALCRAHPSLDAELRELAARWELASRLRGPALEPEASTAPSSRPAALASLHARLAAPASTAERYRDEGEIARGAQGVVRRSFDATLQRHVAMKVLHERETPAGAAPGSSRRLGRFLEEAQVTAQLEHPAIVPVHELGLDAQGAVYFTMKLVKGRSLHEVLAARARGEAAEWTTPRLVGALVRVSEAVAFAHDRGVVHRDLKPANVMLGDYGEVYVMDWGLARLLGADAEEPGAPAAAVRSGRREAAGEAPGSSLLTLDGDVVGTPQYMAPEQAAGRLAQLGPAADVYALGAMLYHVLAGRAPYEGRERSSPAELLEAVRRAPPRPLHEVAPDVPAELSAVCEKAMSREVEQRYASMAALGEDLRAFLERRVVRAYETGPLAELRKWVRRNRAFAAASAGLLLAVLGGLLYASAVESRGRQRAESLQRESDRHLAEVLRLSDVARLDRLRRDADALWPPDSAHIAPLTAWLDEARQLVGRTEEHRATLEVVRARSLPWSDDDARRDRMDPRRAADLKEEQELLAQGQAILAEVDSQPGGNPPRRKVLLRLMQEHQAAIDRLTSQQQQRQTWRFASEEDAWWHTTLSGLLDGLADFDAKTIPTLERRLQHARDFEPLSLEAAADAWKQAIASIADPAQCPLYGGLQIAPQPGLVPLRRNERTGLWEFWDVQLGERPAPRADGGWLMAPETGLVFVLLPGGPYSFGSQSADPTAPNYDTLDPQQTRVQTVQLDPFFISAFEVTQAQWERATGENPSVYFCPNASVGNEYTETNPVDSVDWPAAVTLARHFRFLIPTEAQWEYAYRGGTTTRWWTGSEAASLQGAANIADTWMADHAGAGWNYEPSVSDGHGAHAPVGSYRPNGFGLYDVMGNVEEWLRENFTEVPPDALPGEGALPGGSNVMHPTRGGSYITGPERCTAASRDRVQSGMRSAELGVRLSRGLQAGPR